MTGKLDDGPFDLGSGPSAALCIHGLTGSPYEVRPVAEVLARSGMRAVGPVLAGHESPSVESLNRTSHDAWLAGVTSTYRELRREHESVVVVGLSLGGLLGLALAAEERVDALAVIGTPLRLRSPIPQVVPWLRHLVSAIGKRRGGSDIRDAEARARHPGLKVMPLHAVHELMRLQRRVRGSLARVDSAILVAHGYHDRTADPADAQEIHASVASTRRELLLLPNSAHIATVDHDREALSDAISAFFSGLA